MKTDPSGKPLSTDVQGHVQTAVANLEKALQLLRQPHTGVDIRIAAGRTASATRSLLRACEALNVEACKTGGAQ